MAFMRSFRIAALLLVSSLLCQGCGPMTMPIAVRPQPEAQAQIDAAWNNALEPIDRLNNQALLDTLIATQGYEIGVDKLTFRSEKRCAAGLVVMEIGYDRFVPANDSFRITIVRDDGAIIRQEDYGRDQIELTYHELFIEKQQLESRLQTDGLAQAEGTRLLELEARLATAMHLFPNVKCTTSE